MSCQPTTKHRIYIYFIQSGGHLTTIQHRLVSTVPLLFFSVIVNPTNQSIIMIWLWWYIWIIIIILTEWLHKKRGKWKIILQNKKNQRDKSQQIHKQLLFVPYVWTLVGRQLAIQETPLNCWWCLKSDSNGPGPPKILVTWNLVVVEFPFWPNLSSRDRE